MALYRGSTLGPNQFEAVRYVESNSGGFYEPYIIDLSGYAPPSAPVAPPRAEVPGGTGISAPAQQANQNLQDTYAQYAQQLAAMQQGQGQQPAGPSIWDFMGQGMANAPTRPSMSPYGQAPVSPYGQMASFNPYGTNAPGAGAMFGPTGSGQMGQP